MTAIVVHISDLHFKSESDMLLQRTKEISAAIASACSENRHCQILCTGDIAFAGKTDEYILAEIFFEDLKLKLKEREIESSLWVVPGNHDCFFDGHVVREVLLETIESNRDKASHPEIQKTLIEAQKSFFEFSVKLKLGWPSSDDRLLESLIETDELSFRLINSAWMSSRNEKPNLILPLNPRDRADKKITISCLHHPFSWFTPESARELRRTLEASSDFILTGHEHESGGNEILRKAPASHFLHFEGGVLQDSGDPENSSFVVFEICPNTNKYRRYSFFWNGKRYENRESSADQPRPQWTDFARQKESMEVSEAFRASLEELPLHLRHPAIGAIGLSQIYVYPNFLVHARAAEETDEVDAFKQNLRGEEIVEHSRVNEITIITGDSSSGKTSLAKALFLDHHENSRIPIYISDLPRKAVSAEELRLHVERTFCTQYDIKDLSKFQQLERTQRIIIFDDVDIFSSEKRGESLCELKNYARVVIISDSLAMSVKALAKMRTLANVAHYEILPFGYLHRNAIADKWLSLSPLEEAAAAQRRLVEITKKIDSVLGKNFVPAFPVFILVILQAADSQIPLSGGTSSQGHYHEYLIRSELMRAGKEQQDVDVLYGFLSHLAFHFLTKDVTEVSEFDFGQMVSDYQKLMGIALGYEEIKRVLTERRMLLLREGSISFRYPYVFYFFCARYLAGHSREIGIRELLEKLGDTVHRKRSADILLFLAHLSSDTSLVDLFIGKAAKIMDACEEFNPRVHVDIADVSNLSPEVVLEMPVRETREELLRGREEVRHLEESHEIDSWDDDPFSPISKMLSAIRCMEIVGQILKNSPGHIEAERKKEMARVVYSLGCRAWLWVFNFIRENRQEFYSDMYDFLKSEDPSLKESDISTAIQSIIVGLLQSISFGMVKRIAHCIGAPKLDPTYRSLLAENPSDAMQLVYLSVALDHRSTIPESEIASGYEKMKSHPLSAFILRMLVWEHFQLFEVSYAKKQKLSDIVQMKYRSSVGTSKQNRRLSGK